MEPADIDWKRVESRYVRDDLYEHINAPKWIDLTVPNAISVDDEAWFCRPDCKHPKTFEDFQRCSPSPKKKLMRSTSELFPLGEKNGRDAALKRRGGISAFLSSSSPQRPKNPAAKKQFAPDAENQDPNLCGRPVAAAAAAGGGKTAKEAIKSSAEKEGEEWKSKKPLPKLRSTMSARNLFSGKDILSQISEFCNELKKLASRKERSAAAEAETKKEEQEKQALLEEVVVEEEKSNLNLNSLKSDSPVKKIRRMPLRIETEQDSVTITSLNSKKNEGSAKKMTRMALRVETDKENEKENSSVLREVRAHPPTPQRFPSPMNRQPRKTKASATATPSTSSPLSKPPRSAALGRGVLQELEQCRGEKKGLVQKDDESNRVSGALEAEGKSDVFWFFQPCSYLV